MRILAARGQDPVLIRSRFFIISIVSLFFLMTTHFRSVINYNIIYYKPVVIGCGSGTMTALLDNNNNNNNNNTRFANQNNGLCIYHLFLND